MITYFKNLFKPTATVTEYVFSKIDPKALEKSDDSELFFEVMSHLRALLGSGWEEVSNIEKVLGLPKSLKHAYYLGYLSEALMVIPFADLINKEHKKHSDEIWLSFHKALTEINDIDFDLLDRFESAVLLGFQNNQRINQTHNIELFQHFKLHPSFDDWDKIENKLDDLICKKIDEVVANYIRNHAGEIFDHQIAG